MSDIAETPSQKDTVSHLLFLDGLRAIAAIFVVLHHVWLQVFPQIDLPFPNSSIKYTSFLAYGHDAVDLFIVLSGFCLMLPVVKGSMELRGGPLAFYKRRARRILPPYYIALGLSLVLGLTAIGRMTGTHWDTSLPITPGAVASAILMLQDVWFVSKINHVFWSVAVEWQIYFWFPLFILLWKKLSPVAATVAIVIVGYVLTILAGPHFVQPHIHDEHVILQGLTFQYYGLFAIGMLGAGIAFSRDNSLTRLRESVNWTVAASILATLFVAMSCLKGYMFIMYKGPYVDLIVGLLAVSVMISCSRSGSSALHNVLSARPLVFLGTFAYSIYLIHAPLIQILWQYICQPAHFTPEVTFWFLLVIGTPTMIGIAYLFFLAFERPFISKSTNRAILARETVVSPAP